MGQVLRQRRLVYEETARPQHTRNLAKRGPRSVNTTTDMVASSEVDDEIDARRLQGQIANIGLEKRCRHARRSKSPRRDVERGCVDVHACERER